MLSELKRTGRKINRFTESFNGKFVKADRVVLPNLVMTHKEGSNFDKVTLYKYVNCGAYPTDCKTFIYKMLAEECEL
jgi:hypothetical protein